MARNVGDFILSPHCRRFCWHNAFHPEVRGKVADVDARWVDVKER